ncbi:uncharacterized protein STEHIDRAFT_150792 [Stereum hirsutum FP-91666 SS1]|uniref:Zn(2)-C6 fungal-type domain-containing protein n=1 Tax=Stereum hirsutum (strain FP-91666) TaxID=721885 RepID=R7RXW0_STEHR|nr:uncharacterized protein STEHIDRAFT_150792 [Stereum hirsutum FP-91666 SS1]EIM80246.1 hypothetical protein STEHIDRAFT_150792 [Stereum hirsutum FP-91666 SS1]
MSARAVHAHAHAPTQTHNVLPTSTSLTKVVGSPTTSPHAHHHPYAPVVATATATSSVAATQSVKNGNGAGDVSTGQGQGQGQQVSMKRPPGACSRCKRLKMRCVFNDDASVCQRCTAGGHECVSEGRKARTPSEREFLLRQIRSKNEQVTNVLRQLHTLPGSYTPIGIVPGHLTLSAQEREQFTEVLTYLEKRSTRPLPAPDGTTKAVQPFDSRPLEEDGEVYSDSEDEEMDVERHLLGLSRHSQDHSGDEDSENEDSERLGGRSGRVGGSGKGKSKELARPRALPDRTAPVGFLADASLKYGARGFSPEDFLKGMGAAGGMGIANGLYFRPGPYADLDLRRIIIEREQVPEILSSGLISFEDAKALFRMYFERINTFLSGIDETIYTPASVLRRCPFLFTVICAVSSRYFFERPGLYKIAMHFAKAAAASTVVDGWKTVETCQAYLILAAYGFPTRRFEEDRGWCYTAIATRMAVELNLNKPPPPNSTPAKPEDERHEREMLNNRRTWMLCCIMDYSTAMQLGKPPTILEDELIRNAEHWCSSSTFQHPYDVHLPVIISFLRIMNGFIEAVSNIPLHLQRDETHVTAKIKEFYDRVDLLVKVSLKRGMRGQDERDDMAMILREGMIAYLGHYCRLIILSYGYQADLGGSASVSQATFLAGCIDACFQLVDVWTNQMLPTGNMKYSPEFFYIGAGFTGAFLLRLLHPSLAETIDQNKRVKIYNVAQRLISSLASPVVAIDEEHTPKQYATFLEELMRNMVALWEQQGGVGACASTSSANAGGRQHTKSQSGMREARVQEVAC